MVRVYLTGGLRFEGPDGWFDDGDLPGNQGRIAFAALVVERRALPRDTLADIVWNGRLPAKWEGALSTIISRTRGLIASTGLDPKDVLPTIGGTYAIVVPHDGWVDLEDAIRRLDRAEGALRHDDLDLAVADATAASATLRRPLLPGVESEWVEEHRRRHRDASYRCSTVLARAWLRRADPGLAAINAETAVALDPIREVGHRLLVEAELARGDVGAARRALDRCRAVLDEELGIEPSAATLALFDG